MNITPLKPAIAFGLLALFAVTTLAKPISVTYPAMVPGRAKASHAPAPMLRNAAISVSLAVTKRGIRLESLRDEQVGCSLLPKGELFQITLGDGRVVRASEMEIADKICVSRIDVQRNDSRLAASIPGRQIELLLESLDGDIRVLWRALLHNDANYIRQEIEVTATKSLRVREISWFNGELPGAKVAGRVDGSPVVVGNFFLGCDDPMALNQISNNVVSCRLQRNAPLGPKQMVTSSFVVGIAPEGQMRRAFLYYLERERAHPYRAYLHYNSWYDHPGELTEANCLEPIRIIGENLVKQRHVIVDGMVFDDGWDNHQTLWQFHTGFPRGFTPLAKLCGKYNMRLGVWLSPFGGYGETKELRLRFGAAKGYEINAAGLSLAGPHYYADFSHSCINMIRQYGVNHFKFDGIASGTYAEGAGADYVLDMEAMRRLMLELRQADPNVYINLTTGSWPSPFWLRYADSIWRQGEDMSEAGKGTPQQRMITYRDQEVFCHMVGKGPLYPLNALMTCGVCYARKLMAGNPQFNSAGFKEDVRSFFGSGTSLQELYLQPDKLTSQDWNVLAEAAKWSRANADVLVDTHWIGGDPAKLEVYGYASWSPRKGAIMLRNPDDQPREFSLDIGKTFELPSNAPPVFAMKSPWTEDAAKPQLTARAGEPLQLTLQPFEILILDVTPIRR